MAHTPSTLARAALIAAAVTIGLALMVSWFSWPAKNLAPRELPVAVAGPAPAANAFADQLRASRPDAFEITIVADANAADVLLRDNAAYAAFVLGADGPSLHVASAAGPLVATLLTQAAQQLGGGRPVPVVDIVPGTDDDPRGAGLAAGYLALVLAGMVAGILFGQLIAGPVARLAGLLGFGLLAGLVGSATMRWLGLLAGEYLATAGAITLLTLAIAATVAGFAAVLGRLGIGLGAVLVFVFGNPLSAVAAAPELLPQPWGAIGQLLPPGAGVGLRSVGFFAGAESMAPLWTLVGWSVAGLLLVAAGQLRAPGEVAGRGEHPSASPVPT